MGGMVLSPGDAWTKLDVYQAMPEVCFLPEPAGLDQQLAANCRMERSSPNLWTVGYLAAFAQRGGHRLVSFDRGFARFAGLALLTPE